MNDTQRYGLCHAIVTGWDAHQEHAPHHGGHSDLCHLFRRTWTARRKKGEYAPGFERRGWMKYTDFEIRRKAELCLYQFKTEENIGKGVKFVPFDTEKAVADYLDKEEKCFDLHDVTILWGRYSPTGFCPEKNGKMEHAVVAVPRNKWDGLEPFPGGALDSEVVACLSRYDWEEVKKTAKTWDEWQRPWADFAIISLGHQNPQA
jgi:hypothetical protein